MNSKDFTKIEEEFNIKLPKEYIDIVIKNPFKEEKYSRVRKSLLVDIEEIIYVNKKVRNEGYMKKKWPEEYFIIGNERDNTYSIINLKQKGDLKIYGIIPEDQKDDKSIKKVIVGKDLIDYIEGKKIVCDCL